MPESSEYTRLGDGGNRSLFGRWQYLTGLEKALIIISTVFGVVIFSLAIALAKCDSQVPPPDVTTIAPGSNSTVAPTSSTVAPTNSTVAPTTSTVAPTTTTVAPITSTVAPITTTVAPNSSTVAPTTSPAAQTTTISSTTASSSTITTTVPSTTTKGHKNETEQADLATLLKEAEKTKNAAYTRLLSRQKRV